jgi:hypothetical protein
MEQAKGYSVQCTLYSSRTTRPLSAECAFELEPKNNPKRFATLHAVLLPQVTVGCILHTAICL